MTAHAMSRNADPAGIQLVECRKQRFGQLFSNICVHVISLRPWFFRGINVEAGAGAEVPAVVLALNIQSP